MVHAPVRAWCSAKPHPAPTTKIHIHVCQVFMRAVYTHSVRFSTMGQAFRRVLALVEVRCVFVLVLEILPNSNCCEDKRCAAQEDCCCAAVQRTNITVPSSAVIQLAAPDRHAGESQPPTDSALTGKDTQENPPDDEAGNCRQKHFWHVHCASSLLRPSYCDSHAVSAMPDLLRRRCIPLVLFAFRGLAAHVLVENLHCALMCCPIFQKPCGQQSGQQCNWQGLSHQTTNFIVRIAGDYVRTACLPYQLFLIAVSESMRRLDFVFEPLVKARLQPYFLVDLPPHHFKFGVVRSVPKCLGLILGSVHGDKQPKERFFEGPH